MIKREFYGFEGSIAVSFSHIDFGFVVEALYDTAGERLLSAEIVEQEFTVIAYGFNELLERIDARAHCFRTPLIEKFGGPDRRGVVGYSAEREHRFCSNVNA